MRHTFDELLDTTNHPRAQSLMLPLLIHIDVRQVEEGHIVCHSPRKANLSLGAQKTEAAGIVDDGAHDGFRVGLGPVHGLAGEGRVERRDRDERAVGGDDKAVSMPFLDFGWEFKVRRGCR